MCQRIGYAKAFNCLIDCNAERPGVCAIAYKGYLQRFIQLEQGISKDFVHFRQLAQVACNVRQQKLPFFILKSIDKIAASIAAQLICANGEHAAIRWFAFQQIIPHILPFFDLSLIIPIRFRQRLLRQNHLCDNLRQKILTHRCRKQQAIAENLEGLVRHGNNALLYQLIGPFSQYTRCQNALRVIFGPPLFVAIAHDCAGTLQQSPKRADRLRVAIGKAIQHLCPIARQTECGDMFNKTIFRK